MAPQELFFSWSLFEAVKLSLCYSFRCKLNDLHKAKGLFCQWLDVWWPFF